MEIFQNVPNNRKLTINIERIASERKAKKKVLIVEARNRLKPLNMFFDQEARKKFYKEELKSGEIFEHNEELFQKISACPENLQRLNSAVFPKNAITIIGKIYIRRF